MLMAFIFAFSFIIRILERPNPFADFGNFFHCFYFATITITSIGYGDYSPVTPFGRLASFILMIIGIVIINLVNYSMLKYLDLDKSEGKALNLI